MKNLFRKISITIFTITLILNIQLINTSEVDSPLNLELSSQKVHAHVGEGKWEEVVYTAYPPSITCSGSGNLECKWPQ